MNFRTDPAIYDLQEEKQKRYEASIKKRISVAFPGAGTIEDNLKPGSRVYTFNTECYKNIKRAIQIWHDIWLPKSEIIIVWGELQDDFKIDVKLSVPRWMIKKICWMII